MIVTVRNIALARPLRSAIGVVEAMEVEGKIEHCFYECSPTFSAPTFWPREPIALHTWKTHRLEYGDKPQLDPILHEESER